jgi:hypothetical protein
VLAATPASISITANEIGRKLGFIVVLDLVNEEAAADQAARRRRANARPATPRPSKAMEVGSGTVVVVMLSIAKFARFELRLQMPLVASQA